MNKPGSNLRRIRLLKNLSLRDAGAQLNMSATSVSKYKKGEINLDSKKVIKFAKAYGVKCIDILKVYNLPEMSFSNLEITDKIILTDTTQ